jgi:histidine triad (HIT) family protein
MTERSHDPHCVFCKIVNGQIPSARVLETADAVAFLDINPVIQGHTLIVPRDHHGQVTDLPDETSAHIGSLVPRLARAIKAATGAHGLNVIINNGSAAGQTVDHCHWHIIPRFHDDPVDWPWPHDEYVGDGLGQMAFRIARELDPRSVDSDSDR